MRWITVGPAGQPDTSVVLHPPAADPGITDDERRMITEMPGPNRAIGERLHATIRASAPELSAKLWYGQPVYAEDGKVACFFRGAEIDKERYLTFGFSGR